MATEKISYGTRTAFTSAANLVSLASSAAKVVGFVDNRTLLAVDYKIDFKCTCATSGSVSTTGTIELYVIESMTTTAADYTDGIDPQSASDISTSLKNARLLAILNGNATAQIVRVTLDLLNQAGPNPSIECPALFSIVVYNRTGQAFAATGNDIEYTPINYTVV